MKGTHLLLGAALLLLTGCREEEGPFMVPPGQEENPIEAEASGITENTEAAAYLMEDGIIAHFSGDGNEFASYTLRTQRLDDQHMATYEDNGGTVMLRVYRLSDEKIELVKEAGEFYNDYEPSVEELAALEPISTYLQLPPNEGDSFDGWTVVSTSASVDTPFALFEQVVVLENHNKDEGTTVRKYLTETYGEVKREFSYKDGDQTAMVTSVLESIEQ